MKVEARTRRSRRLIFEMSKRPDLQGMRAVAVLAVFADHLFGWPSGGFVGVDVFFVLSGFFITGLLLKERSQTGEVSFRDFYVRRARRILPSALLVLAATSVAAHYLFPTIRAKETLLDALWAAVFAANFRFETVGADYFQQDLPPSPIQHYWSLSIEEQFYFVWPALLMAIFVITRKLYRRGYLWARHLGLFSAMTVVVGASFVWAMYLTESDPNAAYFSTFTRVWELGIGALAAIAGPWLARIPASVRPALAYIGLAGVFASLFLISAASQFPAPWAALPVLSTALVIASFYGSEVRAVPMLTNRVTRWFGDTSYTLYLWHWPVIILLLSVMPKGAPFYVVAVGVSLGLTGLTYHLYENPIRRSHWLEDRTDTWGKRGRRLAPGAWAFIGAATAAACVLSILNSQQDERLAAARSEADGAVIVDLAPPPADAEMLAVQGGSAPAISVVPGNDPCFGAPAMVNDSCQLRKPDSSAKTQH